MNKTKSSLHPVTVNDCFLLRYSSEVYRAYYHLRSWHYGGTGHYCCQDQASNRKQPVITSCLSIDMFHCNPFTDECSVMYVSHCLMLIVLNTVRPLILV